MKMVDYTDPISFRAELANHNSPVLVQFSADWCAPCKAIAPLVSRVADEYEGRVRVLKLDLDSCRDIADTYDVRGIPALLLFKDGQVVDRFSQERTLSRLSAFLDRHVEVD